MQYASRWAVFGLFFFSGACALIYQITWMRLFRLAMGNTVFTSATVLTALRERRGEYSEALAQMGKAARLRPEDIEVRRVFPELSFQLAEDAIHRGRFQQAVR